jgi:hypothetical protein
MQLKKDMETSMHRLQERFQNQTQVGKLAHSRTPPGQEAKQLIAVTLLWCNPSAVI